MRSRVGLDRVRRIDACKSSRSSSRASIDGSLGCLAFRGLLGYGSIFAHVLYMLVAYRGHGPLVTSEAGRVDRRLDGRGARPGEGSGGLRQGELERRLGGQVGTGTRTGARAEEAGGTDHRRVVGAQAGPRHDRRECRAMRRRPRCACAARCSRPLPRRRRSSARRSPLPRAASWTTARRRPNPGSRRPARRPRTRAGTARRSPSADARCPARALPRAGRPSSAR